jgi:hypothetical protein
MEVDQGAPLGPVNFMSDRWRTLFKHVTSEAHRLGLEVNLNNDAGWNGSGGPWIKPEQSMQKVVWTETAVEGGRAFAGKLPQPQAVAGFYRDIAVLAFPTTGSFRIDNIKVKACYEAAYVGSGTYSNLPPNMVIRRDQLVDLTAQMDAQGRLTWDPPPGSWTILRFGHTSTGVENAPSPVSGRGLECDKLSSEGIQANFDGMMGKLIGDVGSEAGPALVATHIDSWENGAQNWTARMGEEFRQRHGYDLRPFLPVFTGRVVDSLEVSERFLWDLRQTISELVIEKYAGGLQKLAHDHGLRLSIEAYGGPCADLPYAGRADEPMCEFWMGGGAFNTVKGMASAAHTYGKRILGAESFTAADQEKWLDHPGSIKTLGDRAFCEGVNRFVFHRYALQPWSQERRPGMTMGPWGLHYERTQTWWEWSRSWHEYLARCQFLLRQGLFIADLCYLQPEAAPQDFQAHTVPGFDYDECSAEVVLTRMHVSNGRLVLPDGMSYRLLILPEVRTMTPPLLRKLTQLVRAGATVVGPRPSKSPSLAAYPACDREVEQLAAELWGDCDGGAVKEHRLGQGRVIWGIAPDRVLANDNVKPDFTSHPQLRSIHRADADTDIYFVANPKPVELEATCAFRVSGKTPELWWPDSGRREPAAVFEQKDGLTRVSLRLEPAGSVFVIFHPGGRLDGVVTLEREGKTLWPVGGPLGRTGPEYAPKIVIQKAIYGVPGDPKRTRDVRAKLQHLVDAGDLSFSVARMAEGDDPAYLVVKTLTVEYTIDGRAASVQGTDPETLALDVPPSIPADRVADLKRTADGQWLLEAWKPGRYELRRASGRMQTIEVAGISEPLAVPGPWQVHFASRWGGPESSTFPELLDWSKHTDPGVKFYSGTAVYHKTFTMPSQLMGRDRRLLLDLGKVAIMAQVKLNGTDLGTLWKPPFTVEVTDSVRPGENSLEVAVVNLWVNRLIGDESLPEDSERNADGTLKRWPEWLQAGQSSPTGRYTFTSWRLWKKDSPLRESGLIGPVTLRPVARVLVPE